MRKKQARSLVTALALATMVGTLWASDICQVIVVKVASKAAQKAADELPVRAHHTKATLEAWAKWGQQYEVAHGHPFVPPKHRPRPHPDGEELAEDTKKVLCAEAALRTYETQIDTTVGDDDTQVLAENLGIAPVIMPSQLGPEDVLNPGVTTTGFPYTPRTTLLTGGPTPVDLLGPPPGSNFPVPSATPEPGCLDLVAIGAVWLGLGRRKFRVRS